MLAVMLPGSWRLAPWLTLALGAVLAGAARSDEVHLRDGSVLHGTVHRMSAGGLVMHTDFAGEIKIDPEKIVGLSSRADLLVELADGERGAGRLTYRPESGAMGLTGPAFGNRAVRMVELAILGRIEPHGPVAGQAVPADRADAGPAWTLKIESGLNGSAGNNKATALFARVEARRDRAHDRTLIHGRGRYGSDDGRRNANEILGGADFELDLDENLFAFGKAALEFDEFEDLDLRSSTTAGLGHFFIRQPDHELSGRAGIGYQHEAFDDGSVADDAIGEFGIAYMRQIAPWLQFTHGTTYHPTLDDQADYRITSETAGEIPLGDSESWKLKVGMRSDYDGLPASNIARLDTYYFVNLLYEIK